MHDLRVALRQLVRQPGFAIIAILTLALGIGANTAIFSVIHAVLLNPFPYQQADRIAFIAQDRDNQDESMPVAWPDYLEWRARARTLEHLSFVSDKSFLLTGVPEPAVVRGAAMTASAFDLLGIAPQLGRVFVERDDRVGADPVCVLSHALWQSTFGGAPDVLGRSIEIDQRAYTVVGVMPPTFRFWDAQVWVPVGLESGDAFMQSRVFRNSTWVVGRLAPGMDVAAAERELDHLSARIAEAYPESNKGVGAAVRLLRDSADSSLRDLLFVLFAAVGCLLLIACVNVANLVLARALAREREFGIRHALGASPGRLLRQVLAENLPIALLGGAAGVVLAAVGLEVLLALVPQGIVPAESTIRINLPVLGFALMLAMTSTLAFGLVAAYGRTSGIAPEALREGAGGTASRRTHRLRAVLVVTQIGLATTLLIGAGLLLRSFDRLQQVDLGFDSAGLLTVPMRLSESTHPVGSQATQFYDELITRLQGLPAVESVGATSNAPMTGGSGLPLLVEGRQYESMSQLRGVQFAIVMGDYFTAQGQRLVRGRLIGDDDRAGGEPVVVLNEAAVREFLPEGDPIGKRVMVGIPANLIEPGMLPEGLDSFQWSTVVGVVSDVRHFGPGNDAPSMAYMPVNQAWDHPVARNGMRIMLRMRGDEAGAATAVREIVRAMDPDQPVQTMVTVDQLVGDWMRPARFNTVLLATFAMLALVLATIGIYGVVAWSVAQRVREVGVRMALGASRRSVLGEVIGQGMRVVLVGIALGLLAAVGAGQLLQRMLFQISATDATTFVGVPILLTAVAVVACWVPARRAARIDPIAALRGGG